jgi:hypothetical protein
VTDLLLGLAQTLNEVAAGIDAFGHLVRNDAGPAAKLSTEDALELQTALEGLKEARARLEDLLTVELTPELRELNAVALSTVRRLLREMDLEQRVRRQLQLGRPARPRAPYAGRAAGPAAPSPSPSPSIPPTTSPIEVSPDDDTQTLPVQAPPHREKPHS